MSKKYKNSAWLAMSVMAFIYCLDEGRAAGPDPAQVQGFVLGFQEIAKTDPALADKFSDALFAEYWVRVCPHTVAYLPAAASDRIRVLTQGVGVIGTEKLVTMKRSIESAYPNDGCRTAAVMIGRHSNWHRYLTPVHPEVKLPPAFLSGVR